MCSVLRCVARHVCAVAATRTLDRVANAKWLRVPASAPVFFRPFAGWFI